MEEWGKWLKEVKRFIGQRREGKEKSLAAIDARLVIPFEVRGRVFGALVDTGAAESFINGNLGAYLENLGVKKTEGSTMTVQLADSSVIRAEGKYYFKGSLGGFPVTWRWNLVSSLTADAIMGIDLLRVMNAVIDVKANKVTIGVQEAPMKGLHEGVALGSLQPLEGTQLEKLNSFLEEEMLLFTGIKGPTTKVEHRIRVKEGVEPVKQRYYPRNPAMQQVIDEEVDRMLLEDIIEPSCSAWSSPVVLVKKTSGKYRFCIDFRKVNQLTEADAYPLPFIQHILDKLRGAKYISTLDLKQGYWQIPLSKESRPLTSFTVPGRGLFQFKVMPFGLHSAGATFQRLLDSIIGPELEPRVFCYLDDIIIVSQTFNQHLGDLQEVFARLRANGLQLQPEKCMFCRSELKYLGHVINRRGIQTDPEKVEAVMNIPSPGNPRAVRSFLGMASWYRRFIPGFAQIAAPLNETLKKEVKFAWGERQETAFAALKNALTSAPILACPDFKVPFVIQTDASITGLGAVLTQVQEGEEKVIAYVSRTLNAAEKNYSVVELECLAVVWAINKLKGYLEGYQFTVVSDHRSLRWLRSLEKPSGRLARWMLELQHYNFEVLYRKGALNQVADALSRAKEDQVRGRPSRLAVLEQAAKGGSCKWYRRMLQKVRREPGKYKMFKSKQGQLFRCCNNTDSALTEELRSPWRMCVPTPRRTEVLKECHDEPAAGHLGVAKTIARVAQHYYWPGMYRDVKTYVRSCVTCQKYKVSTQAPLGKMLWSKVDGPWDVVSTDLIGPLTRSSSGNVYLLVFQDRFSKWVEVHPLRKATAKTVTNAFKAKILFRFGTPKVIISDNGPQYVSKMFQEMAAAYGITHRLTPPYTPQANPVERMNKVIGTILAQSSKENQKKWDEALPEMVFALNTSKHESTGFTPAMLNFGRELLPPQSVRAGADPEEFPEDAQHPAQYRQQLEKLHQVLKIARSNLAKAFTNQSHHYNLRRRPYQPQVGQSVFKKEHVLSDASKGFMAKLAPKFSGPYKISKLLSPVIVELQEIEGGRVIGRAHVKDVKPAHIANTPPQRGQGGRLQGYKRDNLQIDGQCDPKARLVTMAPVKLVRSRREARRINPWNPKAYVEATTTVKDVSSDIVVGVDEEMAARMQRLFEKSPKATRTESATTDGNNLYFSPELRTPERPVTPRTPSPMVTKQLEEWRANGEVEWWKATEGSSITPLPSVPIEGPTPGKTAVVRTTPPLEILCEVNPKKTKKRRPKNKMKVYIAGKDFIWMDRKDAIELGMLEKH